MPHYYTAIIWEWTITMTIFKFYTEAPNVVTTVTYKTLDEDTVFVDTIQRSDGFSETNVKSSKDGSIPSKDIRLIKLSPVGNFAKFVYPISDFQRMEWQIEYGFFCVEIDGEIFQSDVGNYGDPPEWATHFTCLTAADYQYSDGSF